MAYKNEAAFVAALLRKMTASGFYTQRIETGSTGCGVPDIFASGYGLDVFIEAKNMKRAMPKRGESVRVQWRPGQQAWADEYAYGHQTPVIHGFMGWLYKTTWTCVGFNDGVMLIRMSHVFTDNIVDTSDSSVYTFSTSAWESLNLFEFFKINEVAYRMGIVPSGCTWKQYTTCALHALIMHWFHDVLNDVAFVNKVYDEVAGYLDYAVPRDNNVQIEDTDVSRETRSMFTRILRGVAYTRWRKEH